jgi:hypothetical protein
MASTRGVAHELAEKTKHGAEHIVNEVQYITDHEQPHPVLKGEEKSLEDYEMVYTSA